MLLPHSPRRHPNPLRLLHPPILHTAKPPNPNLNPPSHNLRHSNRNAIRTSPIQTAKKTQRLPNDTNASLPRPIHRPAKPNLNALGRRHKNHKNRRSKNRKRISRCIHHRHTNNNNSNLPNAVHSLHILHETQPHRAEYPSSGKQPRTKQHCRHTFRQSNFASIRHRLGISGNSRNSNRLRHRHETNNGFQLAALRRGGNDYRRRRQQLGTDRRRIITGNSTTPSRLLHRQPMDGRSSLHHPNIISNSQTAGLQRQTIEENRDLTWNTCCTYQY